MFRKLPRWVGFPRQCYVTHEVGLRNLLRMSNGKRPCFMVPYVCPTRTSMLVDSILYELDSKISLSLPYRDAVKLKTYHENKEYPYVIDFSSGKGFHFFAGIEPILVNTDEEKAELKNKIASIQVSIENHLGLECLDNNTVGKIRLPIRIPTTLYVNKYGEKNGLYCINVTPKEFDKGLAYIIELAKKPGKMPEQMNSEITLNNYIESIPQFELVKKFSVYEHTDDVDRQGTKIPSIQSIGIKCGIKVLTEKPINPPHTVRLEITTWLKAIGYTDDAIIEFYKQICWKDWDYGKTASNVYSTMPRLPKCTMLRDMYGEELCKDCPLGRRR